MVFNFGYPKAPPIDDSLQFRLSRRSEPRTGAPEDLVTGSAHCMLIPYWSGRLKKKSLHAQQLSERGGELFCQDMGIWAKGAGEAVFCSEGHIHTERIIWGTMTCPSYAAKQEWKL